ncbi:hypothetical protein K4F52_010082 [Lecanicillium sp. MT-2017a]|nr:hypothetical protein K4F52_010082 [Lecanicillium sp. MT-2017a]
MKLYDSLNDDLAGWIKKQNVFMTGSASTHGRHINVSPKGVFDTHFAILGPNRCAYIDRMGSGCETIAHAYENGRLCLMFMSFGNTPRILRLFCRSSVVEWDDKRFPGLVNEVAGGKTDRLGGARAVIVCDIWQVQTSCGYGVPRVKKGLYCPDDDENSESESGSVSEKGGAVQIEELLRQGANDGVKLDEHCVFESRPTLVQWNQSMADKNAAHKYQAAHNTRSLDGLPGLRTARKDCHEMLWVADTMAFFKRLSAESGSVAVGFGAAVLLYFILVALGVLPKQ